MKNNNHQVLALKYRPKNFNELIGQDVMAQTIINSIKLKKLPNAYLLTGIRGIGKTTTARLIAKAINCEENFIEKKSGEQCKCSSCEEIGNSKHLDILEMDAASKTGIDSIRELIDSSQYAPTSAKYKVIILDEVQQLSKAAFSGLLKTLEEPPPHLKFIFCTTEVKKIPVTIISRCQRFDLHRVNIKNLLENLKKISNVENGKISEAALKLIAKASEGSVRDSLSLLDRALIYQDIKNNEIDEKYIREMLGIADRSKVLELLMFLLHGDQKKSIELLREMINLGLEPVNFLNDLLELLYFVFQKKNLGDFVDDTILSESEIEMINKISADINSPTLLLYWQFILKGLEELSIVTSPILSLEMLIVKLIHLKEIPSYEDVIALLNKNSTKTDRDIEEIQGLKPSLSEKIKSSKDQIKNIAQTKPVLTNLEPKNLSEDINMEKISSFEDLVKMSSKKREVELKYDLERNVNLVKFSEGKIDISFNENLGKNFVRNLSEKLLEWTGKRWVITLTKEQGQKTFNETKQLNKEKNLEEEKNKEIYKEFKEVFDDVELIEVTEEK
tara:strand:- start:1966 stop:3645 length:1680 start_codon:yes stop_codon:yes gene_type:complete